MPIDLIGTLMWVIGVVVLAAAAGHTIIGGHLGVATGVGVALAVVGAAFDLRAGS